MTKRRKPAKNHPWAIFNPYARKPAALREIMSYVAENPNHNKSKRVTAQKGVSVNTH